MYKSSKLKFTSLVIGVSILMSSMLTGCGSSSTTGDKTTASTSTTVSTTTAAPTEAPLALVTLKQYFIGTEQQDSASVMEEMNKILTEKINAKIDFTFVDWGAYDSKMQLIIAGGEEFDLCYTSDWANNYYQNVNKAAFIPLDDLITQYAPNAYKAIPEKFWAATKVDGKTYGFLNYQIFARYPTVSWREDKAKEVGFDSSAVAKVSDLTPLLEKFKAANKESGWELSTLIGSNDLFKTVPTLMGYETIAGYDVPGAIVLGNSTIKVVNQFDLPSVKEYLKLARDWYKKGYMPADVATMTDNTAYDKAGKQLVSINGTSKPGGIAQLAARQNKKVEDYKEVTLVKPYASTSGIVATMTAISKSSKNPERAMMYLELINTDKDLYNTLCFGVKGKHYDLDADGFAVSVDKSTYNPGMDWEFGNQFNGYLRPGSPKDAWEQTIAINESADPSVILGFTFDPSLVKSEIAQCQAVSKEYIPSLGTGSLDPDKYVPIFVEKLKTAGSEKIVAEMQKQLDAWKTSKN